MPIIENRFIFKMYIENYNIIIFKQFYNFKGNI